MLGRAIRDIERKVKEPSQRLDHVLRIAKKIHSQKYGEKAKNKIYSVHAPEVSCIVKGKAHKKYEFGSKALERRSGRTKLATTNEKLTAAQARIHRLEARAVATLSFLVDGDHEMKTGFTVSIKMTGARSFEARMYPKVLEVSCEGYKCSNYDLYDSAISYSFRIEAPDRFYIEDSEYILKRSVVSSPVLGKGHYVADDGPTYDLEPSKSLTFYCIGPSQDVSTTLTCADAACVTYDGYIVRILSATQFDMPDYHRVYTFTP